MPLPLTARTRFLTTCLLAAIAMLPMRPAAAAEFSADQRKEVEAIVHDYLVNHPDVLMEALRAADARARDEARDKAAKALAERRRDVFDDPESPIAGNPKGDVTLVEFFDYRCPYCKQVEPLLEKLVADDKGLRLVYKEFPVLGPESEIAARVALAARKQGKYDAFHRAMMAASGRIDEAVIYKVAGAVGLDIDRLKQDIKSPDIDKMLKADMDLGAALDIDGTPAFVIGDKIIPGAVSGDALRNLIADVREKK